MPDYRSNHSRKPRTDLRAAILANCLLPLDKREDAKALAERYGVKLAAVYQTTIRMRKRGLIPPVGAQARPSIDRQRVDSPDGPVFDLGSIPNREMRKQILANIISVGSNSDRQTAINSLNKMDEQDSTNDSPDVPVTREDKIACIYRVLCACPPDILEAALAHRQRDLTPGPDPIAPGEITISEAETLPETPATPLTTENLPENTGLPLGGGDLA